MISVTGGISGTKGRTGGFSGMTGTAGIVSSGVGGVLVVVVEAQVLLVSEDVVDSLLVVDEPLAVTVWVTHLMATAVFQTTLRSSRTGTAAAMTAPETARRTDDLILRVMSCEGGDFFVCQKAESVPAINVLKVGEVQNQLGQHCCDVGSFEDDDGSRGRTSVVGQQLNR